MADGAACFGQGSSDPALLRVQAWLERIPGTGLSPSSARLSRRLPLPLSSPLIAGPTTPRAPRRPRFGLFPIRSPLLGESLLFSFPPTTGMFRFVGFASMMTWMPCLRMAGCPIRTPADHRPFAPPRGFSQPAASFFASGSPGIPRAPSGTCRVPAPVPPPSRHGTSHEYPRSGVYSLV